MFNDEALSRILTEHANDGLRQYGYDCEAPDPKVCVLQAAYADARAGISDDNHVDAVAAKFDAEYNPGWPLGRFLRWLEAAGLA